MKKIKFLILGLILSLNYSCQDTLDTAPSDAISDVSIANNTESMLAAVNGIHRFMYQRNTSQGEGGVGGLMIINDVMGEDVVFNATSNGWYLNDVRWLSHRNATDGTNKYPYRLYYRIILNANAIINQIDGVSGVQSLKDRIKGQALFYRAYAHFQLVQLYGKRYDPAGNNTQAGIPIRTTVTLAGEPRASVENVYTQINTDIDAAIGLLNGITQPNKSHISQGTAKGLKARIALVQGKWAVAASFAAQARTGFTLMSNADYKAGFNDYTNPEWMWGSDIVEDQSEFFANFGGYMSRNFSSTNIRGNPKGMNVLLYNQLSATDVRKAVVDPTGAHIALALPSNFTKRNYTSQKFLAVSNGDARVDVVYMRMAEMYLIEAEAKARLSDFPGAAAALFTLAKNRDPNYVLSVNTGAALIDEILIQRRAELWGEGFRFLDLKRLNLPMNRVVGATNSGNHVTTVVTTTLSIPAGDNQWTWFIPQDEINANDKIGPEDQNQ